MKHVYLFNEGSIASAYGIGTYIHQVSSCLKNRPDIFINIIQLHSDEKEFRKIESENICYYYFPHIQVSMKSVSNMFKYYRNCWYLLKEYIPDTQSDKLFFHFNYNDKYPLIELIKKHFSTSSIFLTIHYQEWCFKLKGNTSCFKRLIHTDKNMINNQKEKQIIKEYEEELKLFQFVDHLICLSGYTKKLLLNEYDIPRDKITLIYNGLKDEAVILAENEKKQLKKKLFIQEHTKIILFVGRLQEIKGIEFLIRAFKSVLQQEPDAHLVIAGSGNFSAYLKEAKDCWHKITFTGRMEKEDLYTYYQIADVGVLPSFHEQCSYAAMEMMMFGLPVIGTTSTGLCEMIREENRVEIIEDGNTVSISESRLAQIICENLNNDKDTDSCRQTYLEKYSLEKMHEALQEIYR
ncbi:MAG: TIGR04157 family glycosyltransferase [Tannerella sp.]|jgi:glycosyltransferase|nr:TIGR04157 family glycosyltransferase [Tannerella sp.]